MQSLGELALGIIAIFIIILLLFAVLSTIKILKEWERVPVFTLGRFSGIRGPGPVVRIPIFQGFGSVLDTRITTFAYNTESTLTQDNVSVKMDAIMFYRVINPKTAILEVDDYHRTTQWAAQTSLREVIGATELDTVLSHRDEVSRRLQQIVDSKTEKYGVKVASVEIRDVILPGNLQESMAKQAIAEREKRARLTMASAEKESARMMFEAAQVYEASPVAFTLRYWNILKEISENPGAKLIIMPSSPEMSPMKLALTALGSSETREEVSKK